MTVPSSASAATTWYVTKSGKDTNTGKSETAAFLTIQKAIDKSVAGDTIIVGDELDRRGEIHEQAVGEQSDGDGGRHGEFVCRVEDKLKTRNEKQVLGHEDE